jgi:hypothetical protein
MRLLVGVALGFGGGWVVRSIVDSPRGFGVRALRSLLLAERRLGHWAAVEREGIEDLVAEVRSTLDEEPLDAEASTRAPR